jgi:hypothetical protein
MKEALWLHSLLTQIFGPLLDPTTLFSDNQAAIALVHDHQYHAQNKHIDVRYYWIHWVIEEGTACLIYCLTDDMVADTLTKVLPSIKVECHIFAPQESGPVYLRSDIHRQIERTWQSCRSECVFLN